MRSRICSGEDRVFRHSICLILLLVIISFGCSPQVENKVPEQFQDLEDLTVYSANSNSAASISFKKDAIYGDSEEVLIGRIGDIAVDSLGRVFIADVQKQVINVFEANGEFITQLGREGRGPEEFAYIVKLKILDDVLYAADANFGVRRISSFSLKTLTGITTTSVGKNSKKYSLPPRSYPGMHKIFIRGDGKYFAQYVAHEVVPSEKKWQNIDKKGYMYLLDSTGEIESEQLFEFKEAVLVNRPSGMVAPVEPFWGIALTGLSSDDAFFWAWPQDFLIKEYSSEGIYRRSFYYPIKKIPLTKESAVEAGVHEYIMEGMKFMDLPPHWPVLRDMKIDDQNRLWIATTVEDMTMHEWWVLEDSGELITKFKWAKNEPIELVKNGYIYTLETDDESGLQQLVRYEFEIGGL